jgi:ribosomal protein S18 acetylase RimI-like enzyme
MLDIVYENVTSAPTETIVDLYRAGGWWHEEHAWRAAIPQMIRGSFCFLLARESGGRIVGMGRVISDGASDGYIQDVVVLPEFRGRGIGREIIRRLTDRCVAAGLTWIGLVAEPDTQKFYEALGFQSLTGFQPMLYQVRS